MTPEEEEQVRRALASVRADSPLPADVATRLDATLAGLVAERGASDPLAPPADGTAPVDELARRRRRWPRVLVAAASVVVLAYGAGVVLQGLQVSGGDAASTAARDETFAGAGGAESEDRSASDAPGVMPPSSGSGSTDRQQDKAAYARVLTERTVRLHRDTLADDVQRLLDRTTAVDGRAPRPENARGQRAAADLVAPCTAPVIRPRDRYAPARLDGVPATLVVRRGTDGTPVAQVHACGDPDRLLAQTRLGQ